MVIKLTKVLAVLLAVMLFLCSCGKADTGSSGEADDTSAASDVIEKPSARVTVNGTKFLVNDSELWLNGVNTPWHKWNDFDGHMDEAFWDAEFARLSEDHINCTRIWVNCTGETIVDLNEKGDVISVNEAHWSDLEKLFALAEKYEIYIMPTLLSFDHFKGAAGSGERWQALVKSREYSDNYAEKYVKEFCKRFGDNEYVFSIDIMNEPDWVYENEECGQVPWEDLGYFFGKCAATIHENSDILVTVGVAIVKYNSAKYEGDMVSDEYLQSLCSLEGAYLDFYSTHYYNWQRSWFNFPCDKSPKEFGLEVEKPCIIGETHNDDARQARMTLPEKYKSLYDNGWNGILVWMQTDDKEDQVWYRYDLTKAATNAMFDYIPEKIYPNGYKSGSDSTQ